MCRIFYFFFDGLFFLLNLDTMRDLLHCSSSNTKKEIFPLLLLFTLLLKEERLRREARNALEDDEGEQFSSAFD